MIKFTDRPDMTIAVYHGLNNSSTHSFSCVTKMQAKGKFSTTVFFQLEVEHIDSVPESQKEILSQTD